MKKRVIALGFFDSVHKGHQVLIEKVKDMAKKMNATSVVLTFDDNFFPALNRDIREIYTLNERKRILYAMGIEEIIVIDSHSLSMSGDDFLQKFIDCGVVGVVAGKDYTFGRGGIQGIEELKSFCKNQNIICEIVDMLKQGGKKISSTSIRFSLKAGIIPKANQLLGREYSIFGKVERGRGVGGTFGVPTANLFIDNIKLLPKNGVYHTRTVVDGINYTSLTNVGTQPTFESYQKRVETIIIGYSGNLYDQEIEVFFIKRLRDIEKFDSPALLKKQIDADIKGVLSGD